MKGAALLVWRARVAGGQRGGGQAWASLGALGPEGMRGQMLAQEGDCQSRSPCRGVEDAALGKPPVTLLEPLPLSVGVHRWAPEASWAEKSRGLLSGNKGGSRPAGGHRGQGQEQRAQEACCREGAWGVTAAGLCHQLSTLCPLR